MREFDKTFEYRWLRGTDVNRRFMVYYEVPEGETHDGIFGFYRDDDKGNVRVVVPNVDIPFELLSKIINEGNRFLIEENEQDDSLFDT